METKTNSNRIHPLVATAAVAVTLVSLTGIAAITGLLPTSHGTNSPLSDVAASATPQSPDSRAQAATDNSKLGTPKASAPDSTSNRAESSADDRPAKASPPPRVAAAPAPRGESGNERSADYSQRAPQTARASYCDNCGRIESVDAITQAAAPSGLGIAAGAVIGGLLGNQIGDGSGRKIATVAGAVGGGYAGNEVEKRTRSATSYEIRVRMEDGTIRTLPQSSSNGWQVGDRVKVVNGALVSNS